MVSAEFELQNPMGLHLRPAGILCTETLKFKSKITIVFGKNEVNAKSVLGVLSSGLKYGSRFLVVCEGTDEEEALAKVKELLEQGLGEKNT